MQMCFQKNTLRLFREKSSHAVSAGQIAPSQFDQYCHRDQEIGAINLRHAAHEILDERFNELDEYLQEYILNYPLVSRPADDVSQFVNWLRRKREIAPEQRDALVCMYSRRAVEITVLQRRLAHARFAFRSQTSPTHLETAPERSRAEVFLNPVHVWATLETGAMVPEYTKLPATILFFQLENEVRTVVLDAEAEHLLRYLDGKSIRLGTLFRKVKGYQYDRMVTMLRSLVSQGIIAIG
ncbi:hypothetical protein SH668x_000328 [Planctomicrobium sp. SH668]|uniref:hypothetical protein n=1 Tax=Planctomicrobium sp. SH668 TaxID=3448126 RepID=UPI003F5C9CAC